MNNIKSAKLVSGIGSAIFIVFGLYAVILPSSLMTFLSIAIGALLVAFGALQIYQGFTKKYEVNFPTVKLFLGVLMAIIGIVFLIRQHTPYIIFAICFGLWALVSGCLKLTTAIQLRKSGETNLWLFISSLIHLFFGISMAFFPITSTNIWIRILGVYWIYLGICLVISLFSKKEEFFFF